MSTQPASAADLTFGIEIECLLPAEVLAEIRPGGYHRPRQVPGLPDGWGAQSDSSLHTRRPGYYGVEITSPVLQGEDGLRQITEVVRWLEAKGARVNPTCGFHVHVGFDKSDEAKLRRLVTLVARHEQGLFAATGTTRREQGNYSRSIKRNYGYVTRFKDGIPHTGQYLDRYVTLNLSCTRPTVEFRVFAGTTSAVKIHAYVGLCLGLVQKAHLTGRMAPWDAQTKQYRRGAGCNALAFLLSALGWERKGKHGPLGVMGGEDVRPSLEAMKAELRRLAKKYDGLTAPGEEADADAA